MLSHKPSALIVTPYFQTLGGGERYVLSVAQALLDKHWLVSLTADQDQITQAASRFGLLLKELISIKYTTAIGENIIDRWQRQKYFDLVFWVSDGSLPVLFGRKNIVHFQVPLHPPNQHKWLNKLKSLTYTAVVCNSKFTKSIVDRVYGLNSDVWYPPVSVDQFQAGKKENIILAVGRFEKSMAEKRQDVLIECFCAMVDRGLKNWRLVLAGGVYPEKEDYLNQLKHSAVGYPIDFSTNASFSKIQQYYSQAKIFWHAAGFGYDEERYPEKMEHFGMTTVEAMAAGCVPVVMGFGGQKEVIDNNTNGILVYQKKELISKTIALIDNTKQLQLLSKQAEFDAKRFSQAHFNHHIYAIIA